MKLVLLAMGLGVGLVASAEMPPAPPGFIPVLQSPKGAEQMVVVRAPLDLPTGPVVGAHAPPVAHIEFFVEYGAAEADTSLTNRVPFKGTQELSSVRVEWIATAGNTYEVQTSHWINGPWLAVMHDTMTNTTVMTSFCPIRTDIPQAFFRVMSN